MTCLTLTHRTIARHRTITHRRGITPALKERIGE